MSIHGGVIQLCQGPEGNESGCLQIRFPSGTWLHIARLKQMREAATDAKQKTERRKEKGVEDLYSTAIRRVQRGQQFRVDFRRRNLVVGGHYLMRGGHYEGTLGVEPMQPDEFLSRVEGLYACYKYSVPSARSEARHRRYFRALPLDKLPAEDVMYGMPREEARVRLEAFVLCCIVNGSYHVPTGKWFWQSDDDRDLVLLAVWGQEHGAKQVNNKTNTNKTKKEESK